MQHRLVSVEYFMDKMEEWELYEFFDVLNYAESASWERLRVLLSAFADKKKVHKLTDIVKFPWDEEYNDKDVEISNSDVQRLKDKAALYLKNMNSSNTNGSTT